MILSVEGGVILFFCFFNCVLLSTKRQILSVSSLYTNVFQWSLKINSCLPAQCSYCESIFKDLYDFAALAEIHTAHLTCIFALPCSLADFIIVTVYLRWEMGLESEV